MEGIFLTDFSRKLRKLNPNLRVDEFRAATPYLFEYPVCGLYDETKQGDKKYLFGIPQKFVPRNSISGADIRNLIKLKKTKEVDEMLDKGLVPKSIEEEAEERILWRGYLQILSNLVDRDLIDKKKAEKLFRCELFPKCKQFPRNFIQYPQ